MSEAKKSIGLIHVSNVRFSYFYGFEPFTAQPSRQNPNPKPVYTVHGLLTPDHPDLVKIAQTIELVGEAKWKDKWPVIKAGLKGADKLCLHKGDVTKAGKPEYAGLYFISASNSRPFTIVDADRTPLREKDGKPYSGCYGNLIVDIWAQDNNFGQRINATVTGAQFLRHAEAFGGGAQAAAPEEFGIHAQSADAAAPAAAADPTAGLLG